MTRMFIGRILKMKFQISNHFAWSFSKKFSSLSLTLSVVNEIISLVSNFVVVSRICLFLLLLS